MLTNLLPALSFNKMMTAFGLPKSTDEEKAARTQAIQNATKYAIEVPFKVMKAAYQSMEVIRAMAETGNPNSVTDAGVAALCARTAVLGAFMNVRVNASGYHDKVYIQEILNEGEALQQMAIDRETEIIAIVNSKISS